MIPRPDTSRHGRRTGPHAQRRFLDALYGVLLALFGIATVIAGLVFGLGISPVLAIGLVLAVAAALAVLGETTTEDA